MAVWVKPGRLFSSCFICSLRASRSSRRTPARMAASAASGVSNRRIETVAVVLQRRVAGELLRCYG